MSSGKTVAVDFDGVIHSYTSPWTYQTEIRDQPTPGGQDFLRLLKGYGYEVVVQSARASSPQGCDAISRWMMTHGFPTTRITNEKPQAVVYLDDRAMRFNGTWPTIQDIINYSTPWNRK